MGKSRKKRRHTNQPKSRGIAVAKAGPTISNGRVESLTTATTPAASDVEVFLSYARQDDSSFNIMPQFKTLLERLVHAKTGRRLSIFVDQADIAWGENWKDRLVTSVEGASIFIPLLSASYLESDMCRMEFNTFHGAAKALGVTELLLPVMLFDAPEIFNASSTDPIVQFALDHQHEVIEDAILSAPGSPEWKKTMARLAMRLAAALSLAESRLASLPPSLPPDVRSADSSQVQSGDEDDLEAPGMTELMVDFQDDLERMTKVTETLTPAIQALGKAVTDVGDPPPNPTPRQIQTWSLSLARSLEDPAQRINRDGDALFAQVSRLDATINGLRRIADEVPEVQEGLDEALASFGTIAEVGQQLGSLLDSMRPAETLSVPLRKALRPARLGVTRIRDSISIISSWTPQGSG